ncbi:hypothetical protein AYI70_g3764 [Smittium culicis]|uniref:Uncharacterized protein n=1 Tax=Smittium culicis TaxID=133412 RepID=A0A1R1Y221_9FUNG|nr:hypothetical protein AYI70_g7806 [Smittium culicis]OMJ20963.1 hypothetical protein AYI70_g3764 [Smittium culicis]
MNLNNLSNLRWEIFRRQEYQFRAAAKAPKIPSAPKPKAPAASNPNPPAYSPPNPPAYSPPNPPAYSPPSTPQKPIPGSNSNPPSNSSPGSSSGSRNPPAGGSASSGSSLSSGRPYIVGGGLPSNRAPAIGAGILLGSGAYYLGSRISINRNSCTCECINSNATVIINKTIDQDGDVDLGNNTDSIRGFVVCYGIEVNNDFDPCNSECPYLSETSSAKKVKYNLFLIILFILSFLHTSFM